MTPAGQNYPIHEHTFLFWGLYLGTVITVTFVALGIFVLMVHRTSQATRTTLTESRPAAPATTPRPSVEIAPESSPRAATPTAASTAA